MLCALSSFNIKAQPKLHRTLKQVQVGNGYDIEESNTPKFKKSRYLKNTKNITFQFFIVLKYCPIPNRDYSGGLW